MPLLGWFSMTRAGIVVIRFAAVVMLQAIAQQTAATPHVTRAADQQRVNSMAAKAANSALQQQKQQKTVEISKPVTGSGKVITSIVLSNGTKMDVSVDELCNNYSHLLSRHILWVLTSFFAA
jgi:hypothetical protein